jgi:hypothetical protein
VLVGLLFTTALAAPQPLSAGTYALFMHAATHARLPVLGERPGASDAWVLVNIEQVSATRAQARQRTCTVSMLGAGERASIRLGPGFVAAMGTKQAEYIMASDADGWSVEVDLGTDHIGYDPAVTGGKLPQRVSDAGVVDHESDGHPGGTVIVDVPLFGEALIFLAQRTHTSLQGRLQSDGSIKGTITGHSLEQRTLGSTNALMRVSPRMQPDPLNSHWWMAPVPPGTTCTDLTVVACGHHGQRSGCLDALAGPSDR